MTAVDRPGFHVRLKIQDGVRGSRIAFLNLLRCPDEALLFHRHCPQQHGRKRQYSNSGFLPGPHMNGNTPAMWKRVGHNFKFFAVDSYPVRGRIAEFFHSCTDFAECNIAMAGHEDTLHFPGPLAEMKKPPPSEKQCTLSFNKLIRLLSVTTLTAKGDVGRTVTNSN